MNTAKHSNVLFLAVVICSTLASLFLSQLKLHNIDISIVVNMVVSQLIIFAPGLVFYLIYNKNGNFKLFGKIKISTVILLVFFTELLLPLVSAVNVFSQLFVPNEAAMLSEEITNIPFIAMFLFIGFIGPVSEEFVFRGIIFRGILNRSQRVFASAILSAAFFGLMHMNLNQAMYAFVLGAVFALIDYCFDSLLPSVVCHCVINSQNVILIFMMQKMTKLIGSSMTSEMDKFYSGSTAKFFILVMFLFLSGIAVVTTALAALLLYGMCINENKQYRLKSFFKKPISREKVLYVSGIIGMAVCFFVIFLLEPLTKVIEKIIS